MIDPDKLHTTPMGEERIRRNLQLHDENIVNLCRQYIIDRTATKIRIGKNIYIISRNVKITVNASSHTIITAHNL